MALFTFSGGVHPADGKEFAKNSPITEYLPKGDVVLPLGQHIGAPAKPIVSKGDQVLVGQKVAEAGGFVSANIFSSVSGTVKAIEPRMTPAGAKVNSIVIENDGEFKEVAYETKPYDQMSKDEVLAAIKEAGIVGLGGAGFPTHVKLAPKDPDAIEYIIVNGAECEPYITGDYRTLMETPELLIEGLNIVLDMFPKAKGIIGIEDNKKDAIAKVEALVKGDARISVATLKTKYPQGAERSLIYATTGRSINSSMLPADAGCIVDNVATIVAIKEAVKDGKPLYERIVTVTGDAIKNPSNFKVRTGTNVEELIEAAGGFKTQPEKIISGGPMMGMAMFTTDVPAVKTFSCFLAFTKDEVAANQPSNCIRCGRCVSVCPQKLMPAKLSVLADHNKFDEFEKLYGAECVECGSCSFVCPAKRNLAQSMKTGRKQVLANPHVRDNGSTQKIMLDVIIALLPATIFGIYIFGASAALTVAISVATCVVVEYIYQKLMKQPITVSDLSAALTGLLLALNLPPEAPFWMPILGGIFAIIVVKQVFGGLGQNFMNPALGARCFLMISFAARMTSFTYDGVTTATPLAVMEQGKSVDVMKSFLGFIPGTIGETSALLLIIGGVYLVFKKVISPIIPCVYVAVVAIFVLIFGGHGFDLSYMAAQIFSGGLMLGAIFMATDYVTSPITKNGKIIYAIVLGILTGLFRLFGPMAEGVSYSIIIANLLVPLIERVTVPTPFGIVKKGGKSNE